MIDQEGEMKQVKKKGLDNDHNGFVDDLQELDVITS